jgi:hypothetical protein
MALPKYLLPALSISSAQCYLCRVRQCNCAFLTLCIFDRTRALQLAILRRMPPDAVLEGSHNQITIASAPGLRP